MGSTEAISEDQHKGKERAQLVETDDEESSDGSSSSSQSTLAEMRDELKFSIPSNIMFLLGSTCYAILSVLDFESMGDDEDDDYYGDDDGTQSQSVDISFYTVLSIVAAGLLISNALIDLGRCLHVVKVEQRYPSLFHRALIQDSSSAIFFMSAAAIDLYGAFPQHNYKPGGVSGAMSMLSAHLYLLSAWPVLNQNCSCNSEAATLNLVGEIMFLVGSTIDVGISYLSDPDIVKANQLILLRLSLLSSLLWVLDAILYLCANAIVLSNMKLDIRIPTEFIVEMPYGLFPVKTSEGAHHGIV